MKEAMSFSHENRLAREKSPYLLQHADNPVDWHPWGEEAIAKAQKEDKPILLSIGYSTCHWCHVMEHESFENDEIAGIMNRYFVPVKVDREERPDIDNVYMKAVMAMTGHGGWPLTVFLTPDQKPFYGGTYFPPESRWGSPGFKDVLLSIHESWKSQREQLIASSRSLTDILQEKVQFSGQEYPLNKDVLRRAADQFARQFDSRFGGFSAAPKFPMAHVLSFLLRAGKRFNDEKIIAMVQATLSAMADGGIYDHLGGGFHRYSTDEQWHVPHFEKMLYDQAMLARAYLEGYQVTGDDRHAQTAREIFDYVLRDLRSQEGGFFSAEDADSLVEADSTDGHATKKEGAFYVWSRDQILQYLDKEDAGIFIHHFDMRPDGNAASDPHGEFTGKNILRAIRSLQQTAEHFHRSPEDIGVSLARSKKKLFEVRSQRPRPHLDDKVLVDWNGLMISSLAFGARVLGDTRYAKAAADAADFILRQLKRHDGRLLHRYRDGEAAILGTIDDYAFFIHGLLDLYEATFDPHYLEAARNLAEGMVRLFWDEKRGGFFFTASDAEKLILQDKEIYDGALPSGNSVAALDMLRLAHLTLKEKWETKAESLWAVFGGEISQHPAAYAQMLTAFDFYAGPVKEIVLAAGGDGTQLEAMIAEVYRRFLPNKVVILRPVEGAGMKMITDMVPFTKEQVPLQGKSAAYVCENHVCQLPTSDLVRLKELLAN